MDEPLPVRPALVAAAGEALFGDQWQRELARQLQMDERTVRRIAQAAREGRDYRVADGVLDDLMALVHARGFALLNVAAMILRERGSGA